MFSNDPIGLADGLDSMQIQLGDLSGGTGGPYAFKLIRDRIADSRPRQAPAVTNVAARRR